MEQELLEFGTKTKDRELFTYKCGYCNYKFKQWVGTFGGGKSGTISTQVICPKCKNMLKTYN